MRHGGTLSIRRMASYNTSIDKRVHGHLEFDLVDNVPEVLAVLRGKLELNGIRLTRTVRAAEGTSTPRRTYNKIVDHYNVQ